MTKEEKHKMYQDIYLDIYEDKERFCCVSALKKRYLQETYSACLIMYELFELRNKSEYIHTVWFSSKDERVEALKKCIELTK